MLEHSEPQISQTTGRLESLGETLDVVRRDLSRRRQLIRLEEEKLLERQERYELKKQEYLDLVRLSKSPSPQQAPAHAEERALERVRHYMAKVRDDIHRSPTPPEENLSHVMVFPQGTYANWMVVLNVGAAGTEVKAALGTAPPANTENGLAFNPEDIHSEVVTKEKGNWIYQFALPSQDASKFLKPETEYWYIVSDGTQQLTGSFKTLGRMVMIRLDEILIWDCGDPSGVGEAYFYLDWSHPDYPAKLIFSTENAYNGQSIPFNNVMFGDYPAAAEIRMEIVGAEDDADSFLGLDSNVFNEVAVIDKAFKTTRPGPQEAFEEHDVWLAPATTSGTFYFEARVYWRVQYL